MTESMKGKKHVFISHSSKDWDKVRLIRNYIEEQGDSPLLFYLKCFDHNPMSTQDLSDLKSLISREIDARDKFLLCDGINAQNSEFVKWEIEEIQQLRKSEKRLNLIYKTVNMDNNNIEELQKDINKWLESIEKITIISSYEDREVCLKISTYLSNYFDCNGCPEDGDIHFNTMAFLSRIDMFIDDKIQIGKRGIIVTIHSDFSKNSLFFQKSRYKITHSGTYELPLYLNKKNSSYGIDISENFEKKLPLIKDEIERIINE